MSDYVIIRDDNDNGATYGPYPSDETAARLRRLFPGAPDEVYEACDELGGAYANDADADVRALSAYLGVTIDEIDDADVHWGHELHAARDTLGLSLDAVARLAGVTRPRTVKMWEGRDDVPVPYDVWQTVGDLLERQVAALDAALDVIEETGATSARLVYWDDQDDYDAHHYVDDGGRYEMANATNRRLAAILEDRGIDVTWVGGKSNPVPRID